MKIRAGFVSNSSSASFLLGVKGDIHNAVVQFLERYKEEYQQFVQNIRAGKTPYNYEPSDPLTIEFIATAVAKESQSFHPTEQWLRLNFGNPDESDEDYEEIMEELADETKAENEGRLAWVKQAIQCETEKGLTLYWIVVMTDEWPGLMIEDLFYLNMKTHEDNDFCILKMPAER